MTERDLWMKENKCQLEIDENNEKIFSLNFKRRKVTPMVMPQHPKKSGSKFSSTLSIGSISEQAENMPSTPLPSESRLEEVSHSFTAKVDIDVTLIMPCCAHLMDYVSV